MGSRGDSGEDGRTVADICEEGMRGGDWEKRPPEGERAREVAVLKRCLLESWSVLDSWVQVW